ncbi:MAG TPA: DNA/RNA nuclease SfsA, partial [Thermotoga sp.]|nr:DNA/RNA nuclease SfsA [Thermotoga sp.]
NDAGCIIIAISTKTPPLYYQFRLKNFEGTTFIKIKYLYWWDDGDMFITDLGQLEKAIFLKRLNKFLGLVNLKGNLIKVHIHDSGKLDYLLYKGNEVMIKRVVKPHRKTMYDVVTARWHDSYILIHSRYHEKIARKIIESGKLPIDLQGEVKSEVFYENCRIDFLVKRCDKKNVWIEVKGCTLIENEIALFPDTPTKRGLKHLRKLIKIVKQGDIGVLLILIFSKAECFFPNTRVDPDFSNTLWEALKEGVKIFPVTLYVKGIHIYFEKLIPLCNKLTQ